MMGFLKRLLDLVGLGKHYTWSLTALPPIRACVSSVGPWVSEANKRTEYPPSGSDYIVETRRSTSIYGHLLRHKRMTYACV